MKSYPTVTARDLRQSSELRLTFGRNIYVDETAFTTAEPKRGLQSVEADLIRIAFSIYAADLAFHRGEREEHVRTLELTIPVVNMQAFEAVKELLEAALYVLSQDSWTIRFKAIAGAQEGIPTWPDLGGTVLLFSGG